mmetsp:Transcript_57049/g.63782  ORF Transcript_57049/g.63782 Transcript_57049/m.63782 type:complete len:217 (+) Transcript_57049:333-983(+)
MLLHGRSSTTMIPTRSTHFMIWMVSFSSMMFIFHFTIIIIYLGGRWWHPSTRSMRIIVMSRWWWITLRCHVWIWWWISVRWIPIGHVRWWISRIRWITRIRRISSHMWGHSRGHSIGSSLVSTWWWRISRRWSCTTPFSSLWRRSSISMRWRRRITVPRRWWWSTLHISRRATIGMTLWRWLVLFSLLLLLGSSFNFFSPFISIFLLPSFRLWRLL